MECNESIWLCEQTIRHLELLGVWLAAAATTAAVIVSLFLARRGEAVRLKCSVTIGQALYDGQQGDPPAFIWVRITNTGIRPITISAIGWRVGLFKWLYPRKRHYYQFFDPNHLGIENSPLPVTLNDGDTASYHLLLNRPGRAKSLLQLMSDDMIGKPRWLYLMTLRLLVSPSIGRDILVKPDAELLKSLRETKPTTT